MVFLPPNQLVCNENNSNKIWTLFLYFLTKKFYILAQQVVICVRLALQEGSTGDWATQFNGYIVTLLVIFYLQIQNKLPSVLSLQQSGIAPVKCGGELCNISYLLVNFKA